MCRANGNWVDNVATHPDFRARGYAKAVLEHALNCARAVACHKVSSQPAPRVKASMALQGADVDHHGKPAFVAQPLAHGE
ncbi:MULTISPECIES: GNAT family N-acetyltransferase [Delftia]|uniref:GNAT family N-acetyltransferase n=1 Tax=Delftia TaxID=80865 RepID=UPI000DB00F3D|nr:MAG: hypothetical protein DI604_15085 [Delftia acidovorans]